jgi:hypothetical protein
MLNIINASNSSNGEPPMSSNKTKETDNSVENLINSVDNEQKRKDSWDSVTVMRDRYPDR